MPRTIMIMAGGTGGHVFPGLAVADFLRDRGWRIVWLGARGGMEARLVPAHGYEVAWMNFSGVRGKGPLAAAMLPLRLLGAFWQGARAIFTYRPDVVLGMGGYQSFPGGILAALFKRPLVVHEQNAVPGLANRVLARVADRVLSGFPGTLKRASVTGNPVRSEIAVLALPRERYARRSGALRLLVVGGSLGASVLNDTVPRALALLPGEQRPDVTHQAGRQHIEALAKHYRACNVPATTVAFIEDMAAAYARADVVLCRAGALTVAELAAAGVASILVPYPHAVDDHQSANARLLTEAGAALLLQQQELTPERLAELIAGLEREAMMSMAERARALARPEATRAVAEICIEAAR